MNASIGRALILVALAFAAAGAVIGYVSGYLNSARGLRWTRCMTAGYFLAILAATGVMELALLTHDFSVSYVAQVGSRSTPTYITIVSLWSSLEGSILFWALILAVFTAGYSWTTGRRQPENAHWTLATLLFVGGFFAFLIAGPANPFRDTPLPIPQDGPGPNPLLQNHPLMIVHPPMLYLGYVGMSVPFAMGITALLRGQASTNWMRAIRRWLLLPWGFLTTGIVLGGWWAYEVLGWGGYWAWDPVENASFLPWLTATAFLHAAMLQQRRRLMGGWAMVLLVTTFSLTILGTFMTRSGVFNSVHSFTQSDIGPTLLIFLALVLVASVIVLSLRLHRLEQGKAIRSPVSREAAFIVNNFLFAIFTFSVLVGTTFPLVAEAVRGVKVSVGMPFFNQFALPIGVAIVFMMGVGPALPWGKAGPREVARAMAFPFAAAVLLTGVAFALGVRSFWPVLTVFVAALAIAVSLREMAIPVKARRRSASESWVRSAVVAFVRGRRRYGGQIVHIGVAIVALAIAFSGSYRQTTEGVIKRGKTLAIDGYQLRFTGAKVLDEPNRRRIVAHVNVAHNGRDVGELYPAMNHYPSQMNPIGTPAVLSSWKEDLYLSVMQLDPDGAFLGLRVYVNPAVVWLWIALGVMLTGCGIALWPQRRAAAAESKITATLSATPAANTSETG